MMPKHFKKPGLQCTTKMPRRPIEHSMETGSPQKALALSFMQVAKETQNPRRAY